MIRRQLDPERGKPANVEIALDEHLSSAKGRSRWVLRLLRFAYVARFHALQRASSIFNRESDSAASAYTKQSSR